MNNPLTILTPSTTTTASIPVFSVSVSAGFPSPADDHMDGTLDLNKHLIKHPSATFFVRVSGDSMTGAGIHHGDLLVVDKALEAKHNDVVIAVVDGEFTVKRLSIKGDATQLLPENPNYQPIAITEHTDASIWGVVSHVIHGFRENT